LLCILACKTRCESGGNPPSQRRHATRDGMLRTSLPRTRYDGGITFS
jgi:hypothetical protein